MTGLNLPTPEEMEEGAKKVAALIRLYRTIVGWIWPPSPSAPPSPVPPVPAPGPSPGTAPPPSKEPLPGILIIGPGGTGKTTLARLLSGQNPTSPLELPGEYVESMQIEQYAVKDPAAGVVVPPGQDRHRARDWGGLLASIAKGEYRGIILVASHGYHSLPISYKKHRIYQQLARKRTSDFLKQYLTTQRQDELDVLKSMMPHIQICPTKLWLLTVVTKEDVWYGNWEYIDKFYRDGEYGQVVKDLVKHHGNRQFRADVVLASLVICNFTTTIANEQLVKNAAGYDQACQVKSVRRLFDTLDAFRKWEKE
jgi:hypothetical protein